MPRLKQHKLYSIAKEWRSRNLVCRSTLDPVQVETQIYRRFKVKGRELERGGRIFMSYPRTALVYGIRQAQILGWIAIPFPRGSSQPRDQTHVSCIAGRFFTSWATKEAQACC